MSDPEHGTLRMYEDHRCRCDNCRTANNAYQRRARERRMMVPIPPHVQHGVNAYSNYGCRCDVCKEAKRISNQQQYHARVSQSETDTPPD